MLTTTATYTKNETQKKRSCLVVEGWADYIYLFLNLNSLRGEARVRDREGLQALTGRRLPDQLAAHSMTLTVRFQLNSHIESFAPTV